MSEHEATPSRSTFPQLRQAFRSGIDHDLDPDPVPDMAFRDRERDRDRERLGSVSR